jgi:hypothetical protein
MPTAEANRMKIMLCATPSSVTAVRKANRGGTLLILY